MSLVDYGVAGLLPTIVVIEYDSLQSIIIELSNPKHYRALLATLVFISQECAI